MMESDGSRDSFIQLLLCSSINDVVLLSELSLTLLRYGFLAPLRPSDEGLSTNINCLLIGDEVWNTICYITREYEVLEELRGH